MERLALFPMETGAGTSAVGRGEGVAGMVTKVKVRAAAQNPVNTRMISREREVPHTLL